MELTKQLIPISLQVLKLLHLNLILPLTLFKSSLNVTDLTRDVLQLHLYLGVLLLLISQLVLLRLGFVQWLRDILVGAVVLRVLLL